MNNGDRFRSMDNQQWAEFIVKQIGADIIPFCVCSDSQHNEECLERLASPEGIPEEWCIECCKSYLDREVEK